MSPRETSPGLIVPPAGGDRCPEQDRSVSTCRHVSFAICERLGVRATLEQRRIAFSLLKRLARTVPEGGDAR
jgi:hypothetical protein